eukprot:14826495-Alexandrium_andersonii.AAC.1
MRLARSGIVRKMVAAPTARFASLPTRFPRMCVRPSAGKGRAGRPRRRPLTTSLTFLRRRSGS